mgnify:CR=1 FL=1
MLTVQEASKIRDALWADDALLDAFIAENPANLSPEDLEIADSWHYHVAGHFFVLRHLKKYALFLSDGKPPHAYGVLGLLSPLDEVLGPDVPILVNAVLIPFHDKITYDGILAPYRVQFGGGIRADLNMSYRDVKEWEGIITSLLPSQLPSGEQAQADIRARNGKVLAAFRKELQKSALKPETVERHVGTVETFAETYLLQLDPPRPLLSIVAADLQAYLETAQFTPKEANAAIVSFKRYVRFLWNTARSDPNTITGLQDMLQEYRQAK